MNISILTPDSKRPNLAAMKIAAFHRAQGDDVFLNVKPNDMITRPDFTYASVLFRETPDPESDFVGGPKYPEIRLDPEIERMVPDYSMYPEMNYSLGYTYKACPRTCEFCIVPKQHMDETHYSIWTFHQERFKKIALLNNNWLADPFWRETFHEIWEAGLVVIDNSGFDARLITEESAAYIRKTRFAGKLHVAWDFMEHEAEIMRGIKHLLAAGISPHQIRCYVLTGYNTTEKEDMHRIRELLALNVMPFPMPYKNKNTKFNRVATMPGILRGLDVSGNTYESVFRQVVRGRPCKETLDMFKQTGGHE